MTKDRIRLPRWHCGVDDDEGISVLGRWEGYHCYLLAGTGSGDYLPGPRFRYEILVLESVLF